MLANDKLYESLWHKKVTLSIDSAAIEAMAAIGSVNGTASEKQKIRDSQKAIDKSIDSLKINFKPAIDFYGISHDYRAKNAMGALIKVTTVFEFDKI